VIGFLVQGTPSPQGSHTAVMLGGRAGLIPAGNANSRRRHKDWRAAVADAAHEAIGGNPPLDGALILKVVFRCAMPASRSKFLQHLGCTPKSTAPDLDKLLRALGDSLTEGGLVRDDARFATIHASKVEVVGWTGAEVRIGHLDHYGDERVLA